jgi:hypothetical protein
MAAPEPAPSGWMQRLAVRWGVSPGRVLVILLVFALTGTTVMLIKHPVLAFFTGDGPQGWGVSFLYYLLILPVYNLILLIYGALLGQFSFFWAFEKRFFNRLRGRK